MSPKAVRMLDDFHGDTLKENCEECVRGSDVEDYRDPHFSRRKDMFMVARRLAGAGLLRR